jgi:hypothetical protein
MPKVLKGAIPGLILTAIGIALLYVPGANLVFAAALIDAGLKLTAAGLLTGVAQSLLKKPSMNLSTSLGRNHISVNPQAYGKWVFGRTTIGTDIIYSENHGSTKQYVSHIIAGASHLITSYETLTINDELVSFSGVNATGTWSGALVRQVRLGNETDASIPAISDALSLPSTATGKGIAHFQLRWTLSSDKLKSGIPTRISQEVKGAPVYDPRKDTSVGGSGAHRANDQTTWEFNNGGDIGSNWALVVLFYLIGWRTVAGDLVFGVGVDLADIDYAGFMVAANICDQTVDSIPRYRVGGIFLTDQNHENIISQLEAATGGKVSKFGGKYTIWIPNDDLTPVNDIGESDILRDIGVQFIPSGPIANLFNTFRGRYIEPDLLWQPVDYPEVQEATAVTEDGRERVKQHDFSIIQDKSIAERVARQQLRRSRFSGTWRLALGPKGLLFKPFSITTLNIQETNNVNTVVRVIDMEFSLAGIVILTLMEEDSSIYVTTDPLGTAVTQLDPLAYDPSFTLSVVGLTVADTSITGVYGTILDALDVNWSDPGGLIASTQLQYKISTDSVWINVPDAAIEFTQAFIFPVEPGTIYDVRARHMTIASVPGAWSTPVQETAGFTQLTLSAIALSYVDSGYAQNDVGLYEQNTSSDSAQALSLSLANEAILRAAGAEAIVDGKVVTFLQNAEPAANVSSLGDLWIDLDAGNNMWRFDGTIWVDVQDVAIITALNDASTAQATADGKIVSFFQEAEPSAGVSSVGDLWTKTSTRQVYRYSSGLVWQTLTAANVVDNADVTSANTAADTSSVNGTAAATVKSGAALGATSSQAIGVANNADVTSANTAADTSSVNGTAAATVKSGAALGTTSSQATGVADNATVNTVTSGTATPTGGVNGDLYWETDIQAWWTKVGGAWTKVSDITLANVAASVTGQGALATLATVNTAQIDADATLELDSTYTAGTVGLTASWATIASYSITVTLTTLPVEILGVFRNDHTGSSNTMNYRVRRDTTVIYGPMIGHVALSGLTVPFAFVDTPGAGTYTYDVQAIETVGANHIVSERFMSIKEIKR